MIGQALRWLAACAAALSLATTASAQESAGDWSSFLGNDAGTSYSPLDQIDRRNVDRLAPVWLYSLGGPMQNAAPVVADGVLYVATNEDRVHAFDATTGDLKWISPPQPAPALGRTLRGSAAVVVGHGLVFYGTSDNHLAAFDIETGREVWDVEIEDRVKCRCQPSMGILLVKDKVVVGVRGDSARRSFINAFDAKTGRHVWRWWTTPGPGEPGHETWTGDMWKYGGGATWLAGSYDPKLNLIYWGTANPQPIMGGMDPGDKLWTNSLVAIDADTGKLKWGFQETPGDQFDFDSNAEPMLVDAPVGGKMTPLVIHAVKSGYTYVVNRATGKFIAAYPHAAHVTWNKGIDSKGKPIETVRMTREAPVTICPSYYGSRAANHAAYSPKTGLWYGSSVEFCSTHIGIEPPKLVEARSYNASKEVGPMTRSPHEPIIAGFDPVTGERRWTVNTPVPHISSFLATGGDLLFGSDLFGKIWARDAETGDLLWSFRLGVQNANPAITYAVDGRQYVAVVTGGGGAYPMRIREMWPEEAKDFAPGGAMLAVFALPREAGQ